MCRPDPALPEGERTSLAAHSMGNSISRRSPNGRGLVSMLRGERSVKASIMIVDDAYKDSLYAPAWYCGKYMVMVIGR
jgi:hypothetical protein